MSLSDSLTEEDDLDSNDSNDCSYPSPSTRSYLRSLPALRSPLRGHPCGVPPRGRLQPPRHAPPPPLPPTYKYNLLQKLNLRQLSGKVRKKLKNKITN